MTNTGEVLNKMGGASFFIRVVVASFFMLFVGPVFSQEESQTDQSVEDEIIPLDDAGPSEADLEKDIQHEAELTDILRNLSSPDEKTRTDSGIRLRKTVRSGDTSLLAQTLKRGNNLDKQLFIIDALTKLGDKKAGEALRFEVP